MTLPKPDSRGSASVRGRVTDRATGAAIAGATVCAAATTSNDRRDGLAEAATGRDGGYRFTVAWNDTGDATLVLDVRAPGYELTKRAFALDNGGTYDVDLALGEGFSIALEVTDEAGGPLAGAKVTAILNDRVAGSCAWPLTLPGRRRERGLTDAHGRMRIDGFSAKLGYGERYVLAIAHPNHVEALVDRPEQLERTGGVLGLSVRLEHGHALEGTVAVPTGAAAQATSITAYFQDPTGVNPACHPIAKDAQIGDGGRFRMTGLAAGEHILRVHNDAALDEQRRVTVPAVEPLSIELRRGRSIEGVVIGNDGARLTLEWDTGQEQIVTDGEGRFNLASVPIDRPVLLTATSEGGDEFFGARVLAAGSSSDRVRIDARDRVEVTGQAIDRATGLPLPFAIMIDGEQADTRARFRVSCETRDGRFKLCLPKGRYEMGVRADEGWEERYAGLLELDLTSGAPRHLVVPLVAVFPVDVIVRDERGVPLCDAAVAVVTRPLWSRHYSGRTDAEGRVTLELMIPDVARLRVQAEGFAPVVREIDFAEARAPLAIALSESG